MKPKNPSDGAAAEYPHRAINPETTGMTHDNNADDPAHQSAGTRHPARLFADRRSHPRPSHLIAGQTALDRDAM